MLLSKERYTRRLQALLLAVFFSCSTLILHTIGHAMYLYWVHWWFDIIVHMFGGFSIGFLGAFLFSRRHAAVLLAVLFLSVIGWEVFEVVFAGVAAGSVFHIVDTVFDVLIGFAAASASVYVYNRSAD